MREKGSFLTEFQIKIVEGMRKITLGKYQLLQAKTINGFQLKLAGQSMMKNRILAKHQGISPYVFINYKKNSNFIVEKFSRYHLNQVIKVNITVRKVESLKLLIV